MAWAPGHLASCGLVTGKGQGGERPLRSLSGCEGLNILLGSGTWCLLLAVSKSRCLCFTELQGDGHSEVCMQLWCWACEAVAMSSDVPSIFIFGASDPADSMYRGCQPPLFSSSSLGCGVFFFLHL